MTWLGILLIGFGLLILAVIAGCVLGRMIATPDDDEYPEWYG